MTITSTPHRTSWVTPELVAGRTVGLSDLRVWQGRIYWLEQRPAEGRTVLLCAMPDGAIVDVTGTTISVGSRVHEYGGGAYALGGSGPVPVVICSNRADGDVLRLDDATWHRIAGGEGLRFADFSIAPDGAGCVCVREDHRGGGHEPANTLVWLDGADETGVILARGADFYASPRLSPDGRRLAWIEWDHPSMPWDATRLMVASARRDDAGRLSLDEVRQAAGSADESVLEPVWMADGALVATTDRSGFWRPADMMKADGTPCDPEGGTSWPVVEGEIGLPHWVFGQATMAPLLLGTDPALLCLMLARGTGSVCLLTRANATTLDLGAPQNVPQVLVPAADLADSTFAWIDMPDDRPAAVVSGRPGERPRVLRRATALPDDLPADAVSRPEALVFPSGVGQAHALYYPPGPGVSGLPPLVVMAHGGPTGRASPAFSFKVQWWTSRGFAVLDVNYRGSTGFGRAYRAALDGQWGVVDVADVLAAVRHVIATGRVDPARCVMRGSSAGGLTVLCALAQSDLFAAGTSLYGVTDLRALAAETHKFEARYMDRLIGPYPAAEATYLARSPIAHVGAITSPVLFLHGSEDRVVPPAQAADMAARLGARGVRVVHHVYEGEGHGFRQESTLLDASVRELAFYLDVFGG